MTILVACPRTTPASAAGQRPCALVPHRITHNVASPIDDGTSDDPSVSIAL